MKFCHDLLTVKSFQNLNANTKDDGENEDNKRFSSKMQYAEKKKQQDAMQWPNTSVSHLKMYCLRCWICSKSAVLMVVMLL